jgi:hypothetical protein
MEIIKQIEKQLGIKLKPVPFKYIMAWQNNGYALDKTGQVQGLNLDNREIKDISFLKNLSGLTYLSLKENQITDLTPLREFKHLQRLNVRNNHIQRLPPGITSWWPGLEMECREYLTRGLNLYGNPLTDPPVEIVIQGKTAVQNYFAEIEEKAGVLFLESKLLLVGSGDVGRTTLMKKLKDNNFKVVPGKEDSSPAAGHPRVPGERPNPARQFRFRGPVGRIGYQNRRPNRPDRLHHRSPEPRLL